MNKPASFFAFFIIFCAQLAGFELFLNSGVENGKNIKVLHIRNREPFACDFRVEDDRKEFYKCTLSGKSKLVADQSLDFFDLKFINQNENLEIFIYPKTASKLFNTSASLYKSEKVHLNPSQKSTRFSILFYPDLKVSSHPNGLDFSIIFPELLHPHIGALDLDQNPVNIADNNDINLYLSMKKSYDAKEFELLLEQSERAINTYAASIFLNEFHLFRLRAMDGLLDSNTSLAATIIEDGKNYLREFSSSPNYAEVVAMIVHSYLRLSQRAEAEYFIDILNSEQPDEYFTKLANLDYADYLIAHKKTNDAISMYNNILFSTKDAELASKAAIALAKINISHDRLAEAKEFVIKVLDANENYLKKHLNKTISLADEFYAHKMYEIAINLYELVLKTAGTNEAYSERVEKNLAFSFYHLERFDEAKTYLERYKKYYADGEFAAVMDELADSLYFEQGETDSFKLHEYYRLLMAKYDNHIAARALKEEAKLLFKERDYSQIFALKEHINASEDAELKKIYSLALGHLLKSSLHQDECDAAIIYLNELGRDELSSLRQKQRLLACLHSHFHYAKERELAQMFYPEDPTSYDIVLAQLDFEENNYKSAAARLEKTLQTRRQKTKDELASIYKLLSLAYLRTDRYNDAIAALKKLERYALANMQLVEVYSKFLGYFKLHKLQISAINYGQKAINIQNHLGVNLYSPELEFITLEALFERQKYRQMIEICIDLAKLKLSDEEATRMHYLRAQAHKALGQKSAAIAALEQCSAGQWKPLCDEELSVLNPPPLE